MRSKFMTYACVSTLFLGMGLASCSKMDDLKNIFKKDDINLPNNISTLVNVKGKTTKYKVPGLGNDLMIFGGKDFATINESDIRDMLNSYPYPIAYEGNDEIYLRNTTYYKNEFYFLRRKVLKNTKIMVQDEKGDRKEQNLKKDQYITIGWNTEKGFEGYYKYLSDENIIDKIAEGDTIKYVIFAKNNTDHNIPTEKGVTGVIQHINTSDPNFGQEKRVSLAIESKQITGMIMPVIYEGDKKYTISNKIFDKEVEISTAQRESKAFGIF